MVSKVDDGSFAIPSLIDCDIACSSASGNGKAAAAAPGDFGASGDSATDARFGEAETVLLSFFPPFRLFFLLLLLLPSQSSPSLVDALSLWFRDDLRRVVTALDSAVFGTWNLEAGAGVAAPEAPLPLPLPPAFAFAVAALVTVVGKDDGIMLDRL